MDPTALTITLYAREFIYSSAWCAQLESTYSGVVSLGVLPAGSYAIQAKLPDGSLLQVGVLPVAHARSANPDDFLYAPVESMHLEGGASSTRPILVLNGTYSNGCGRMKQVKLHRAPHLIEVLPIAEIRTSHCTSSPAVFEERVELGPVSAGDRVLIHVRSLNGQALNQVHQF